MATCPYCRQEGAIRVLWYVRCPNPVCPKFDESMRGDSPFRAARPDALLVRPEERRPAAAPELREPPVAEGLDESLEEASHGDLTRDRRGSPGVPPPAPVPNPAPSRGGSWRGLLGTVLLLAGVGTLVSAFTGGGKGSFKLGLILVFLGWQLATSARRR